jgi:hypothetical protein
VGRTSAIYGVRDSDAYFVEAAAAGVSDSQDGSYLALRQLCVLVLDISGILHQYPRVLARCVAFLSSAMPLAFDQQKVQPYVGSGGEDIWTMIHVVVTSRSCDFLEDVLSACSSSRMHDSADLRVTHKAIFGAGVSKDARGDGLIALCNVRLLLCHTILLLFILTARLRHCAGQPPRFIEHVISLYKLRLLPPVQKALQGDVSSRWPEIREALGVLSSAMENAPLSANDVDRLGAARLAFLDFSMRRFLMVEGCKEAVETQVDPYAQDPEGKQVDLQMYVESTGRTRTQRFDPFR